MLFWCGFAGILFLVAILQFYKTRRWFVVFRNFRVISMWFAVFLCYSVWYLYVIQCSFVVFLPPLCPPLPSSNGNNDMKMSWNCDKKRTIPNTIAKYWQLHGLDLLNMQNDCFWNSDGELCIPPTPHRKGTWLITASCRGRSRNIPNIGGRMKGLQTSKYYNCFKPLVSPFWTCCYIFLFCVAKFITDEMQIWKRILHIICGKIPDNQQFYCFPPFLYYAVFD